MKRKDKLTVNTLAGSNLKTRKKQYSIMIIGILLAMIFSSGILFFASSLSSTLTKAAQDAFGLQDAILTNADENAIINAKEKGLIDKYCFSHVIGMISADDESLASYVGYYDDEAMKLSNISFIEGNYPQAENEIAFEKAALARLRLNAKIGDTIQLRLYPQNGNEVSKEFIEKEYKLVGIATDKHTNLTKSYGDIQSIQLPSVFVSQGTQTEVGKKELLAAYVTTAKENNTDLELFVYNNYDYHIFIYANYKNRINFQTDAVFSAPIASFTIILAVVLLIIACLGIINAFSNNLNERKKQIGMFKTLGATKRQIINIYGREAFFITLICVPFSLIVSYFGIKLLIGLIDENLTFVPNIAVLLLSGIFSVVCVMAAALIPLIKASRISPIQSIRNIEISRKMKKKKIKSQKEFSMPRLLSQRNLSFNRGRQIAVCFILIATILISSYGFSYLDFVSKEWFYDAPNDYELRMSSFMQSSDNLKSESTGFSESDKQDIMLSPYVKAVAGSKICKAIMRFDEYDDYLKLIHSEFDFEQGEGADLSFLTPENIHEHIVLNQTPYYKDEYDIDGNSAEIQMVSFDESYLAEYKNLIEDGEFNMNKINSGEEIILYMPKEISLSVNHSSYGDYTTIGTHSYSNERILAAAKPSYKAGDTFDFTVINRDNKNSPYERKDYSLKIGAIVHEMPNARNSNELTIITTTSAMDSFCPQNKYKYLWADLATECDEEINKEMLDLLNGIAGTYYDTDVYSDFEYAKEQETSNKTFFLSLISIIILFLSISGGIINNSLTAQIRESKRKIGTMRAVGASHRDIFSSYIRQLLSIFGISYGVGFGGFLISYWLIYAITKAQNFEFTFYFNIHQTIIACLILFAICSANLWLKIKQETKNSIIDNIREL